MSKALEERLRNLGAVPIDKAKLQRYKERMERDVIPNILRDVKERQRLAAKARFSTSKDEPRKSKR